MKFSINWISELVAGLELSPDQLANRITLRTAEVDGVHRVGARLAEACAARVISAEAMAGGHNRKAVVDTGRYGVRTVVCGAPNCRAGMTTAYVPLAARTIGGIESDGMLASGAELGLNRDSQGILDLGDAAPGSAIRGCAPDFILEIDNKSLTHRPDLWGHHGMAREVSAIAGLRLADPVSLALLPAGDGPVLVEIEDHSLCPRYSALVFDNVTVGPSPLWLQYRLEAIGLNPINNIVDVTNYVMAELAQPMHAFDRDTLAAGPIRVRLARAGEKIAALNGESYALDAGVLVIADARGPVAIAGVIGGLNTGVTAGTTRILLESASFHPSHVRKTAARLKCRTDASMRFEKSQDPRNTVRGLARAIALLEEVSPGIRLAGGLADNCGPLKPAPVIALPVDWLARKLGRPVETGQVRAILEALEFQVSGGAGGALSVTVPSWRATRDISIKDDLVEEVGRMLGYDSITPAAPALPVAPPHANPERDYFHHLRGQVTAQGFTEVYNYSFVNEDQLKELGLGRAGHVAVLNPIASDQGLLRSSLLAGLLRNIRDNIRHLDEFRLFEIGFEIHPGSGPPAEVPHLAACVWAKEDKEDNAASGLTEARRLAESILPGAEARPIEPRGFEHPFRAFEISWRGAVVGRLFEFHPNLVDQGRAAVIDIDLQQTRALATAPAKYRPLRRYPSSSFDLSVVAGSRELAGDLQRRISAAAGPRLLEVEFVRQYTGPPLAEGKKSLSFRVTVGAADHTLDAEEINQVRSGLIAVLQRDGFELRI